MSNGKNHASRRKTPWDDKEDRTASQEFLYRLHNQIYEQKHPDLSETEEDKLINSFVPISCPHCESEHINKFGTTENRIDRYLCRDCQKTFTPVTGTIFEDHKISITEWHDYLLNLFRYVSINADSWSNRNAFTTARFWLEKVFLILEEYYASVPILSGKVYLDETYYSVRGKDFQLKEDGTKPRGLSRNKICIGTAVANGITYCAIEGKAKPSKKKTLEAFGGCIEPGSTLIHDGEKSHRILIETLSLVDETHPAKETSGLPDEENPLRKVNKAHAQLKKFLYAHNSFDRDSLQGYLNLFCFTMNPPKDPLEKVDLLLNLSFKTRKKLTYREFYSLIDDSD